MKPLTGKHETLLKRENMRPEKKQGSGEPDDHRGDNRVSLTAASALRVC